MDAQGQDPLTLSEAGIASVKGAPALERAGKAVVETVKGMTPLQQTALATAPVPVVGDVAGLAADAEMYATQPEERTGLNYLMSAAGLLPFVPSASAVRAAGKAARKEYGVKLPGAEDPNFENKVVELPVKFETDNPALQNMSVSYVEPVARQKGGEIEKYRSQDMPAPTDEVGVVRLTAPTDDLANVKRDPTSPLEDQSWKGPIHEGHMPMYVGGDKGFSPTEVSALRVKMADLMEEGMDDWRAEFGSEPDEEALAMILADARKAARRSPEYQNLKNAPVGFARFVDTRILDKDGVPLSGDKDYMRTTEVQSDLYAEARGDYIGESVPETYEGMLKNDRPLTASIVKGLVATAKDRGKKGVVLPSSETSEAGVRYSGSNLKKLTNKVKADLGEGYSVRKAYVENVPRTINEPGTLKERNRIPELSEHVVIEWDAPDMPDEVKFQDGGIVALGPRPKSRGLEDVIRKYRREGMMD